MRSLYTIVFPVIILLGNIGWADIIVFKNGSRSEVQSVEIGDRGVSIVTLNGKKFSILRDAVDVEATLEVNRLTRVKTSAKEAPEALTFAEPPARIEPPTPIPPPQAPPAPPPEPLLLPYPDPPRSRVEGAAESKTARHRLALYVNGATGTSPLEFAETERFELFKEEALIDHRYRDPKGRGIEIGGVLRVAGPLGVSAAVEFFRNDREAAFDAFLPHPFFYERYRELSGTRSGLIHEERALHLGAVFSTNWGRRFSIDVFAGPSLFFTRTEVLSELLYTERYPYDDIVPLGVESQIYKDRPWGFNAGAGATYRMLGHVGLNIGVRFSRGRIRLFPADNRAIEFDAGGLRAGAGLTLLFP